MTNIKLSVALAIVTAPTPQPVQALILVILLAVNLYQLTRPQDELDTDQDLRPVTAESYQKLEPAPSTPAVTRPPLERRNCFVLGPNGLTSEPLPPDWESRWSSSTSDSEEGYETAPDDAAPARTMAETRALAYFEERLRRHQESVSSETSACASSPAAQRQLTTAAQIRDLSDDDENCFFNKEEEDEAEMLIKRRNIKMREEGVRVRVNYSQLSYLKPAPSPRSKEPAAAFGNATTALASTTITPPPYSSYSSPSSAPSTTPSLSGLLSPAPTPCDGIPSTGITTPDHQASPASVLPTSGRAAAVLDRIDEQLLAIPADATSRRLLRDGRASLYRSRTLSRSVVAFASVGGSSSGRQTQTPSPVEGGVQYSKSEEVWYPSEMMD